MAQNIAVQVLREISTDFYPEQGDSELNLPGVADTLLGLDDKRPPYLLITAGACVYIAALAAALLIDFSPPPVTLEAPFEMVSEDPPTTQPEQQTQQEPPPPQPQEKPPEPVKEPPPPEPVKETPTEAVEPAPKPPEPVKEVEQKPVEQKPQPKPAPKPKAASAARHVSNATVTNYVNQLYARINRLASANVPTLEAHQAFRVRYAIVIGTSGQLISKSVFPSGNAALDRAVADVLQQSAPFPAPPNSGGTSYRIEGAIAYHAP